MIITSRTFVPHQQKQTRQKVVHQLLPREHFPRWVPPTNGCARDLKQGKAGNVGRYRGNNPVHGAEEMHATHKLEKTVVFLHR